ncbi:MAG: phage tail tube protein [Gemmobacter sp.]|uniref:phage tail tube protein n=1 Tax=Gemmobacter sp. TaxID=1898957 RepID=UPI00391B02BE
MSRHVRNTVIQAELETTYGSSAGITWNGSSAILIAGTPRHRIERDTVPRDLIRNYFGGSEHLIASRKAVIEFSVELAGSGAAATPPAFGKLLRACGMAETITVGPPANVSYNPITTAQESVTLRYFVDGVMYVSRGCRGTVQIDMTAYERPMLNFTFHGFDTNAFTQSTPNTNFSAWQRPLVISDENSGDISIGGTYSGGWVSGGTILPSRGLQIDLGNTVSHIKLLGGESIDITARETTGKFTGALTADDEVAWRTALNANELTSMSFRHGSAAGSRVAIHAGAVQRITPEIVDYEGRHLVAPDLRFLPVAGNDEIRIAFS